MNKTALSLLVAGALAAAACGEDQANPFANFTPLEMVPTDADLVFTSNMHAGPGALRDAFALAIASESVTRLTFCTEGGAACDTIEAAPHPDRARLALRRITTDANGDGSVDERDGVALVVSQLDGGFESPFTPLPANVTGIDWLPIASPELIVYSGDDPQLGEDLFTIHADGANNSNISQEPDIIERRARVEAAGRVAVYERTNAVTDEGEPLSGPAKTQIWIFQNSQQQFQVTEGGPGEAPLPGSRFLVGSDTDPVFSPDSARVAFRRLTATGNGGLGSWDVLTASIDGGDVRVVASGPEYRGAPDWGEGGIVFVEWDGAVGPRQLVVSEPDGSARRTVLTLSPSLEINHPRWVPLPLGTR